MLHKADFILPERYNKGMKMNSTSAVEESYNNSTYLREEQYQSADNLNARIEIHRRFSTAKKEWNDFIFEHIPFTQANFKGLALGCGNATQWRENQSRFPRDTRMVLSEFSYGMLQEPRFAFAEDERFQLCTMDAQHISFASNSFDFVSANHMLYHVPDIALALSEVRRVLKADGSFMAATNGEHHMTELDQLLESFNPVYQGEHAMSSRFTLQNGENQLFEFFDEVALHPYQSDLWVTDAGLLCDYAWSTPKVQLLFRPEQKESLRQFFEARIQADGGIFIGKDTGLFIARKPRK